MYDSKKVYRFEMPSSCLHNKTITQLHRFDAKPTIDDPWRGVIDGEIYSFCDNDPRLVEADEVVGYHNVYPSHIDIRHGSVERCVGGGAVGKIIGRIAVHASGRVRNIPLDATTDPEADQ